MKKFIMILLIGLFLGVVTSGCEIDDPDDAYNPVINPEDFVDTIDNQYYPMTPGTTFTYIGEIEGETEEIRVYVTNETRKVMGITCVVVRDTVTVDDELVEDTYDWYAQDMDGNVWYMGEDSKEYEDDEVVSTAGSWEPLSTAPSRELLCRPIHS